MNNFIQKSLLMYMYYSLCLPPPSLSLSFFLSLLSSLSLPPRCHLIQARPGTMLSDILINSPVMAGEDGVPLGMGAGSSNFDPLMDPMAADDPELAMVSQLL